MKAGDDYSKIKLLDNLDVRPLELDDFIGKLSETYTCSMEEYELF
jgi:hypothetical protein